MGFTTIKSDCASGKAAYESGVDADTAAEWAMQRGLGQRWPYLCRLCGWWHVTSRKPGLPPEVDHHR